MDRRLCGALLTASALTWPALVMAQPAEHRWQLEVVGGLSVFTLPTSGTSALPPAGPVLQTSGPTNPSRRIPTWFLGDGASLLNGTIAEFGVASRLVPLDDTLGQLGVSGANAPVVGVRLRRGLSPRWSMEVSSELWNGTTQLSPDLLKAVETSRASFESAFAGLFLTGPFAATNVRAVATQDTGTSREVVVLASARYEVRSGAWAPYVTAGGGLIGRLGSLPAITLRGSYAFQVQTSQAPSASFAETDTLTLRHEQSAGPVGMVGAGLHRQLSSRTGLSLDGRVYLADGTLALRLDSRPEVTTSSSPAFIESFTTPSVQFSNNGASGRASSLSGAPLNGFKAFTTSGLQIRYAVTAGVFIRF